MFSYNEQPKPAAANLLMYLLPGGLLVLTLLIRSKIKLNPAHLTVVAAQKKYPKPIQCLVPLRRVDKPIKLHTQKYQPMVTQFFCGNCDYCNINPIDVPKKTTKPTTKHENPIRMKKFIQMGSDKN